MRVREFIVFPSFACLAMLVLCAPSFQEFEIVIRNVSLVGCWLATIQQSVMHGYGRWICQKHRTIGDCEWIETVTWTNARDRGDAGKNFQTNWTATFWRDSLQVDSTMNASVWYGIRCRTICTTYLNSEIESAWLFRFGHMWSLWYTFVKFFNSQFSFLRHFVSFFGLCRNRNQQNVCCVLGKDRPTDQPSRAEPTINNVERMRAAQNYVQIVTSSVQCIHVQMYTSNVPRHTHTLNHQQTKWIRWMI